MLEQFTFLRPHWLWGLFPLLILLIWQWRQQTYHNDKVWRKICDPDLLPHLKFINLWSYEKRIPLILLGIGWLLAVLALAGPSWSKIPSSVYRSQQARLLILDLSKTMDIRDTDTQVSRLELAKYKILDILNQYGQEGQTALVVFAGDAYVVLPLTDDMHTIAHYIQALKTDLISVQGKRTWLALQKAGELLEQAGVKHGDILLVTDSVDDLPQNLSEARQLKKQGYHLSVLTVSISQNVARLEKLAIEGGGIYIRLATHDNSDLKQLLKLSNFSQGKQSMNQKHETRQDQGYWFLLLLLPLAALSFRRGWLGLLLLCIIGFPQTSYAFNWHDLWQRSDQQAAKILAQGITSYRAKQYKEAATAFAKVETAQAYYNLGNALAHLGKYETAITAYQDALIQNPQYLVARHNLAIVKKLLKQQQSQKQDSQNQSPKTKPGNKKRTGASEDNTPKESKKNKGLVKQGKLVKSEGGQVKSSTKDSHPQSLPEKKHTVENEQMLEQLLENIQSDLGEMLKRKFQHQEQSSQ